MIVRWVERKDGQAVHRVVNYQTGEVLKDVPVPKVHDTHALSRSNGFCGTEAQHRKELQLDAKNKVDVKYHKVLETVNYKGEKVAAYKPEFLDTPHRNKWLRSRQRVNFDGGYSDPCPGDFVGR